MARLSRSLFAVLALLSTRVFAVEAVEAVEAAEAACVSYGIDYANGGAYYIDGSSNQYFTFVTVFQGCTQETISPVLVGPNNDQYACSSINTTPGGQQVTSSCGIPFSAMKSGVWKIIISGQQVGVQRSMTFNVGIPETTTVIATPTVVIGITSTQKANTVVTTVLQTQTLILVPQTVTAGCNGATRTVTAFPQTPTITITSTIIRTQTDQKTSQYTTVVSATAVCHYPTKKRELAERAVNTVGAVAAVTVTYTQTTFTVTQTQITTIQGGTTTELVFRTVTATVTPAAATVCAGGGQQGVTVTVNPGGGSTLTQTNIAYQTTHLSGTIWVGQTQYTTFTNAASATACWRAGGWYGA